MHFKSPALRSCRFHASRWTGHTLNLVVSLVCAINLSSQKCHSIHHHTSLHMLQSLSVRQPLPPAAVQHLQTFVNNLQDNDKPPPTLPPGRGGPTTGAGKACHHSSNHPHAYEKPTGFAVLQDVASHAVVLKQVLFCTNGDPWMGEIACKGPVIT